MEDYIIIEEVIDRYQNEDVAYHLYEADVDFEGYSAEEMIAYQNEEIAQLQEHFGENFTLLENQSFTLRYFQNDLILELLFHFPEDYPTDSYPTITSTVIFENENEFDLSLKFQHICEEALTTQEKNLGYHMVFNILNQIQPQLVLLEKIPEVAVSDFLTFETKPKAKKKVKLKKKTNLDPVVMEKEEILDLELKHQIIEDESKPFPKVETRTPKTRRYPSYSETKRKSMFRNKNSDFTKNELFVQSVDYDAWQQEIIDEILSQNDLNYRKKYKYECGRMYYCYEAVRPNKISVEKRNVDSEILLNILRVVEKSKEVQWLSQQHFNIVFTNRELVQNCMEADQEFYTMVCEFGEKAMEWFMQAADLFLYRKSCIKLLLAGIDVHPDKIWNRNRKGRSYMSGTVNHRHTYPYRMRPGAYQRPHINKPDLIAFHTQIKKDAKKHAKVLVRAIGQGWKRYPEFSEIHVMIVGSFLFPWMFETLV